MGKVVWGQTETGHEGCQGGGGKNGGNDGRKCRPIPTGELGIVLRF
jgi:hypothetical protein